MPRLLVIKGADEGKQFDLTEDHVSIGRDTASNRIRLTDTEVSRRHAEFFAFEGGYAVRDVGSANGTFVNGEKINQPVTLQAGDRVQIGQTQFIYSTGRGDTVKSESDLADRISMITRPDVELSSAIIKSIGESEGSQLLAKPDKAKTPWLKTALANLTIMYEASQAISHILDLGELLDKILELSFGSIKAERGCIMLQQPDSDDFDVRAVRFRDRPDRQDKIVVSRTIVDHVLREKQGVLVSDATQDERFNTGQSIVRFGIREVICVPMRGRHETLGVLYLDTRTTAREVVARNTASGKFTEDHLLLAIALAHQAALAVEETRYHQAMLQAERLAAIGQTVATLSHEIKNILQGLKSGSEILQMGLSKALQQGPGSKEENLLLQGWKIVERNQARIADLAMNMLSYSKERAPAIEDVDLNALVREVAEFVAGRARELGVALTLKLDPALPMVQADPQGMHRALLNIAGNALDAVAERPNPKLTMGTRRDAEVGWVNAVVVDNGTGIPPEKLGEIFKPFVSSKGARGTGLGLAVSKKILREHGGDIVVDSKVGVGSRFVLRLPIRSPLAVDLSATNPEMPVWEPPDPEEG